MILNHRISWWFLWGLVWWIPTWRSRLTTNTHIKPEVDGPVTHILDEQMKHLIGILFIGCIPQNIGLQVRTPHSGHHQLRFLSACFYENSPKQDLETRFYMWANIFTPNSTCTDSTYDAPRKLWISWSQLNQNQTHKTNKTLTCNKVRESALSDKANPCAALLPCLCNARIWCNCTYLHDKCIICINRKNITRNENSLQSLQKKNRAINANFILWFLVRVSVWKHIIINQWHLTCDNRRKTVKVFNDTCRWFYNAGLGWLSIHNPIW